MYVLLGLREHESNSVYMWQSMISWFVLWLAFKHVGGIHWNNLPFTCNFREANVYTEKIQVKSGIFHVEKHSYTMRECCCINKYFIPCHGNTVANTRLDIIPCLCTTTFLHCDWLYSWHDYQLCNAIEWHTTQYPTDRSHACVWCAHELIRVKTRKTCLTRVSIANLF